jgi:excisionase family DNA binding protein
MQPSSPMTVSAAARAIGVTTRTIRRWIADQKLPAARAGEHGRLRIPREAVERLTQPQSSAHTS